ncbi:ABC transporter ATP-binding protein [Paenibacillus rigui]|uniref:ABC transporter ATP-binding protein n=1 Tax=Paenibacillus rigui TaxID=554312 RepID=A0A229UQN5_9BACL|nr:ABC transporter ATP-binding protein [Paenibacillus rigui]OXM85179.1 ABC transporter ATP-binding protein [Paenibacillus rigui]
MIEIRQVQKSFRVGGSRLPILQIPEWSVGQGERIALIGPSGSGKSTLLHLLGGVIAADSGQITVGGHALHTYSEAQRDRFRAEQVGYIFQDFHLISSLTARQNVELVLPAGWSRKERATQLQAWFHRVGLGDRQHHLPSQLSRGQQQRVAIIRALIHRPPFILADEPTGSLDWEAAGAIMQLLLSLCEEEGLTLLTVTHDLHLADLYPVKVHMSEMNALMHRETQDPAGKAGSNDSGQGGEPNAAAPFVVA